MRAFFRGSIGRSWQSAWIAGGLAVACGGSSDLGGSAEGSSAGGGKATGGVRSAGGTAVSWGGSLPVSSGGSSATYCALGYACSPEYSPCVNGTMVCECINGTWASCWNVASGGTGPILTGGWGPTTSGGWSPTTGGRSSTGGTRTGGRPATGGVAVMGGNSTAGGIPARTGGTASGGKATGGAGAPSGASDGGPPGCSVVSALPAFGTACSTEGESLCDVAGNRCVCAARSWYCDTKCDPARVPLPNTACPNGLACNYPSLGVICSCVDSVWMCLGAGSCPAVPPTTGDACAGLTGIACDYPGTPHLACACVAFDADSTWTCIQATRCPDAPPSASTPCPGPSLCTWGTTRCGCLISGARWTCI